MISILDGGHLFMPTSHAVELADLLHHLSEVLRCGGDDLHSDIDDRYQPGKTGYLIEALDHHGALIGRATRSQRAAVTK
jgi:hypothetical protein